MDKTNIELICGFLESGKTTLIQRILENDLLGKYNSIVVLQCEEGEKELHKNGIQNPQVTQVDISSPSQLNKLFFEKMDRELNPDLLIVEYNGTWKISDFLKIHLPYGYAIDQIVFCADASTFQIHLNNTGQMMKEQLINADDVLFNRAANTSPDLLKNEVKNLNTNCKVYVNEDDTNFYIYNLLNKNFQGDKRAKHWGFILACFITLTYIGVFAAKSPTNTATYAFLRSVNTAFLGIIVQALPFLLIGVFISSILQLFISDDLLAASFAKHPVLSIPLAAFLGILFPVCDCAMVPIVSRLVRKGVPVPQAMIFLLASSAVNPVTIISTFYAFPGQRDYVVYRILLGITVALAVGIILCFQKIETSEILLGGSPASACSSGFIGSTQYTGTLGNIESIFRHAGLEFFNMGRFIICGALISSIIQSALPSSGFQGTGKNLILPLLIMMLASFIMSVCSTSNAFIGRSFLSFFPPSSVMGFIVMGPMLDLSNLFMLSANFNKKFVLKLTAIVFSCGFITLLLFSNFVRM